MFDLTVKEEKQKYKTVLLNQIECYNNIISVDLFVYCSFLYTTSV